MSPHQRQRKAEFQPARLSDAAFDSRSFHERGRIVGALPNARGVVPEPVSPPPALPACHLRVISWDLQSLANGKIQPQCLSAFRAASLNHVPRTTFGCAHTRTHRHRIHKLPRRKSMATSRTAVASKPCTYRNGSGSMARRRHREIGSVARRPGPSTFGGCTVNGCGLDWRRPLVYCVHVARKSRYYNRPLAIGHVLRDRAG